jgi:hypothetical protein
MTKHSSNEIGAATMWRCHHVALPPCGALAMYHLMAGLPVLLYLLAGSFLKKLYG